MIRKRITEKCTVLTSFLLSSNKISPLLLIICVTLFILGCLIWPSLAQTASYIGALIVAVMALCTYVRNSNIKQMEFIDNVYKEFDTNEGIDILHRSLIEDESLEIEQNSDREPALLEALTLFDKICNYYEFKIIDDKALSYIAAEILDFYRHNGVKKYISWSNEKHRYIQNRYKEDIWFYSGLNELGKICEEKFVKK